MKDTTWRFTYPEDCGLDFGNNSAPTKQKNDYPDGWPTQPLRAIVR